MFDIILHNSLLHIVGALAVRIEGRICVCARNLASLVKGNGGRSS